MRRENLLAPEEHTQSTHCISSQKISTWQDPIYRRFQNIQNYLIGVNTTNSKNTLIQQNPCFLRFVGAVKPPSGPYDLKKKKMGLPKRKEEKRGSHTALKQYQHA